MNKKELVCKLIKYIDEHMETAINLSVLAEYTGFSSRYIQILFNNYVGMPLGLYIRKRRIMRAATLLRLTNTPIIDIAYLLQFDSQQTFTREFKKNSGLTPLAYRKNKVWHLELYKTNAHQMCKKPLPPRVCTMPGGFITGHQIGYDEPVPSPRIISEYRWESILYFKHKKKKNVWLLTEFTPSNRSFMAMNVCTALGVMPDEHDTERAKYFYPAGLYALFNFKGTLDGYHEYIKNIYYKVLPHWGYNRQSGPDVECFHFDDGMDDDYINCDIHIPVIDSSLKK
ncbi:helix-turn-helix domain-containing protein [Salmonella enterica]|nr:helix-turn-helix domain-containing protein [Salmonella enterica]EME7695735.1 helix-turn-helix domain-containing protein [Salmonella enterica]